MEKGISFLEGFGDAGQGDGFVAASPAVAPYSVDYSACVMLRVDTFDLSGTLADTTKFICGNFNNVEGGWGFKLGPSALELRNEGVSGLYDFTAGDKAVGGRVLVAHSIPDPQSTNHLLYLQGTFVGVAGTFGQVNGDLFAIGATPIGLASVEPFGDSSDIPSARNGIAGVAYSSVPMTAQDVADHYRVVLEAEDMVEGDFASWTNLWSVRRGLPDLELAGGDSATWTDEIGGAVLTRTQFNQQTPSMRVEVRPARLY